MDRIVMEICGVAGQFSVPIRYGRHVPANTVTALTKTWPSVSMAAVGGTGKSELESRNRMFILGMGFVGQFLAQELKNNGWIVSGTCTTVVKKKELEDRGFDVHLFDANEPDLSALNTLKYYTHLLVSVPTVVGIGDPVLQHKQLLRSTLMDGNLQWLCYLSSTSVYGDSGGAWVDEDCPASPTSESAKLRVLAEEGWLNLAYDLGLSSQVFRLGGIYGPRRSAVDTIIKRETLSEGQKMRTTKKFTSRVHVEDIIQALMASINIPSTGSFKSSVFRRIYNIVDDDPAPREVVFAYARKLVENKWPGQILQNTSGRAELLTQKRGEKRVSNARMKKELGVRLQHPSYRSGLQSIINQMEVYL